MGDSWLTFLDEAGEWSFPLILKRNKRNTFLVSTGRICGKKKQAIAIEVLNGVNLNDDVVLKKATLHSVFESFDRAMAEVEGRAFGWSLFEF